MTSACSTGRAAAVTMPRMFSAAGSWRESEYAVLVLPRMAHANAIAKNRRIAPLLPLVRVYGHAAGESNRDWRAKPPPSRPGRGWRVAGSGWVPRDTRSGSTRPTPLVYQHHTHLMKESSYRTLVAWQRAISLAADVYTFSKTFPMDERYG